MMNIFTHNLNDSYFSLEENTINLKNKWDRQWVSQTIKIKTISQVMIIDDHLMATELLATSGKISEKIISFKNHFGFSNLICFLLLFPVILLVMKFIGK